MAIHIVALLSVDAFEDGCEWRCSGFSPLQPLSVMPSRWPRRYPPLLTFQLRLDLAPPIRARSRARARDLLQGVNLFDGSFDSAASRERTAATATSPSSSALAFSARSDATAFFAVRVARAGCGRFGVAALLLPGFAFATVGCFGAAVLGASGHRRGRPLRLGGLWQGGCPQAQRAPAPVPARGFRRQPAARSAR
jgi:hypothetical protein